MRIDGIAAGLAAALLATSPGVSGSWERTPLAGALHHSCTSELQRCREKLAQGMEAHGGGVHDWSQIESALLRLRETDPECSLLLQGTGLQGL